MRLARHAPTGSSGPINTKSLFLEYGRYGADVPRQNDCRDLHLPNAKACVKFGADNPDIQCVARVRTLHIRIVHT